MTAPRKRLHRFEHTNHARFLTFSCYRRLPLLDHPAIRDLFAQRLALSRSTLGFHLYAWVVMPEHVHLLLWPLLPDAPVPTILHDLKKAMSQTVIARWRTLDAPILKDLVAADGSTRFWQRGGGYDRNIFSRKEFDEKIHYIHHNPVSRELVSRPDEWAWSSAKWYSGDRSGTVAIDPLPPTRPERRSITPPER